MLLVSALAACADDAPAPSVTRWLRHQEAANALAGEDLGADATAYVASLDADLDLALSSDDGWEVMSISRAGLTGLRHARLQQVHAGVPVFGCQLLVHADDTTFVGLNGRYTAHLDGLDVEPAVSGDEALAIAEEHLSDSLAAALSFSGETTRLVILPVHDLAGADLAWQVEFASGRAGEVEPGRWTTFVDADDGGVLRSFDAFDTVEQASGAGGNAKVARTWVGELDVEPDGTMFRMETDRLVTLDRRAGDTVVTGPLDDMPDPVANDAHGHSEITLDMMRDWMGRDSLDDAGLAIVSRVHDTSECPGAPLNACWNGSVMSYGDGGDVLPFVFGIYPFSGALDVVAHELNHGFTMFHTGLAHDGQPGGLNESFSDVAGTVAEFYHEGDAADFDIGEDISKQNALRFMCDPPADSRPLIGGSIDHMDDFTENMDPHYSSGVGNRAFCLAAARYRASSWGSSMTDAVHNVGQIWYEANANYWLPETGFLDACQGTVDAARGSGYDSEVVEAVAASWADVGVVCDGFAFVCNGDGACDAAGGETCASCAEDCGACSEDCSWFRRAKCSLGIGDCSRCDLPEACGDGACDGSETDASCGEDCGCGADPAACDELSPAPFGCFCDADCAASDDCCADVGEVCGR
jgi:Zn-dependent metalloprotease